ncbi:MAG: hypothetical protein HUJ68_08665 [Clostridia bacterium]|nr:hypothetical protein [Clostridia bacterium]
MDKNTLFDKYKDVFNTVIRSSILPTQFYEEKMQESKKVISGIMPDTVEYIDTNVDELNTNIDLVKEKTEELDIIKVEYKTLANTSDIVIN